MGRRKAFDPARPRPWVRFWARCADYSLFSMVFFLLLLWGPFALWTARLHPVLVNVLFLGVYVPVEAWMIGTWGTTPGKWLFRVRLAARGGDVVPANAFARSFKVWFRGLGFGLPFVPIFTCVVAYRRLQRNGETSWDREEDFTVEHGRVGALRIAGAVLLFFLVGAARQHLG
ncbi:MAG: RDD family protein [Synergistales bacterium]|nr:RDD family protein [Synergistales bacterium]